MASLPRSARLLRALFVASCMFPLVQACGRSDPGDYLYNADGTISEGASANTTAGRGSTTTGGTRTVTGGSNSTGNVGNGATGGLGLGGAVIVGGTGTIPQGGSISIGGRSNTAGTTSIGGITSAGAPAVTPITCGTQTCNPDKQVCCAGLGGISCIGINQDCGGAVLGCTVNEDCAGNDICCISITGDANSASSCKASCDTGGTGRDRQLCQTADECREPFRFCTATIFGVSICTRRP